LRFFWGDKVRKKCVLSSKKEVETFAKIKNLKKQTNEQTMVPSTRNRNKG
jgi:hypothetical protein